MRYITKTINDTYAIFFIFLKVCGYNIHFRNTKLLQYLKIHTIYDLLDYFNISYSENKLLDTLPCLLNKNDEIYVVSKMDEKYLYCLDKTNNKIIFNIDDEFNSFIEINELNCNQLKCLKKTTMFKNKLYTFFSKKILLAGVVFLSILICIFHLINAFLLEMIFDVYVIYENFYSINSNYVMILISCLVIIFLYFLLNYISRKINCLTIENITDNNSLLIFNNVYYILYLVLIVILVIYEFYTINTEAFIILGILLTMFISLAYMRYNICLFKQTYVINNRVYSFAMFIISIGIILIHIIFISFLTTMMTLENISIGIFSLLLYLFCTLSFSFLKYMKDIDVLIKIDIQYQLTLINDLLNKNDINYLKKNIYNLVIENYANIEKLNCHTGNTYLIYGNSKSGKTYLTKLITKEVRDTNVKIYLDTLDIENIDAKMLKRYICIINKITLLNIINNMQIKDVSLSDIEYLAKSLGIIDIKSIISGDGRISNEKKETLSDTELFLLAILILILKNVKFIIVDNIIMNYNQQILQSVLYTCKTEDVCIIALEQNNNFVDFFDKTFLLERVECYE